MPNVGFGELGIILLIILLVMGPKRMPDVARALGKAYRTFQAETRKAQAMLKEGLSELDEVTKEIKGGLSEPINEAKAVADDVRLATTSFDDPMSGVDLPPAPPIPPEMAAPVQPNPPVVAPPPPGVIDMPDEVRHYEDT